MFFRVIVLVFALLLYFPGIGSAGHVGMEKARIIARNWLHHCISAYGSWGGVQSPAISGEETLMHQNEVVGYNFLIYPKGNILVAARDDLPPVKLYSDTRTLSVDAENTQEIATWIADEISQIGKAIDAHGTDSAANAALLQKSPDVKAWTLFSNDTRFEREYLRYAAGTELLSLGPLMTTTWAQSDPYNQQCPLDSNGCRTIVGCVATAASQIMKYWSHPKTGAGNISYLWNSGATSVTLGRVFSDSTYDWANMPNSLDSTNTTTQKDAVSKLCANVGIAFQMEYGCNGSSASTADTPNVLKTYFRYMNTATWVSRSNYDSTSAWMQVFKNEVQNGRPSELRLRDPNSGGHAVVVDGYRDAPSEMVHINMGWAGSYDGWYVPDSFVTGSSNWTATSYQGAAIGIQPDKTPEPVIRANGKDSSSVTESSTSPISINLSLDAGDESGKLDDWWIILSSPWGYYSWIYPTGWTPGIIMTGQMPLSDFSAMNIFDGQLPVGEYTFYFGVDENPDGKLDPPFFYDSVTVHVVDEDTL
ncbi:MAG: C10 family peptidase [Deltaproteobacteria bacterium]|nr:C10 family peptidase [Deltaproteobacteria bacterium]